MDERVAGDESSGSPLNRHSERCNDERNQTESFDQAGDLLRTTAGLKANPIEDGERGQCQHTQQRYMSGKPGEELSGKFPESDRQGCVGDGLNGPVADTHNESGFIPECPSRVDVPSSCTGKHATKLGDGAAAKKRIDSAEEPDRKDERAVFQEAGDGTRRSEDATTDRVPDTDSQAKTYAKYAQQV